MPVDFGQLLGGILAGVAEARSLGDRYSRGLALLYEKDDLLRAFPVPRAELDVVEVSLSFAVSSVDAAPPPEVRALVDRTRAAIVATAVIALREVKVRRTAAELDATVGDAVEREIERSTLLAAIIPKAAHVESFDIERVTRIIVDIHKGVKAAQPGGALEAKLRLALKPILDTHTAAVDDLRGHGIFVGKTLSVLATHNDIATVSANAVSNIKITINLRNYEWTQTDVRDGQPMRKLVRE